MDIDAAVAAHWFDRVFIELTLFAAVGFLLGGLDELAVDMIWLLRALWKRIVIYPFHGRASAATGAAESGRLRYAVVIPAWDEALVIGSMIDTNLQAYDQGRATIFLGCYHNDPKTLAEVRKRAGKQVRLVLCDRPGPTTKANCLNEAWREIQSCQLNGERFDAIILHDAEDLVSRHELDVFDRLIDRFGLIQLPVIPLVDSASRWIAGHYCDEFAEAHGKTLIVREAIGAALPLAGVGCAIRMDVLEALSLEKGGRPFDEQSLTEDYEAGLRLNARRVNAAFVSMPEMPRGRLVGTRTHFPATLDAAVRQKSRWLIGIGITGWDRLGWGKGFAENWMRARDRRGLLAAVVLLAGYCAFVLGGILLGLGMVFGRAFPILPAPIDILLQINAVLLIWRLAMRSYFVTRIYGWRQGMMSVPRAVVANIVAILAARRAVTRYFTMLKGGSLQWDKTAHVFPGEGGR